MEKFEFELVSGRRLEIRKKGNMYWSLIDGKQVNLFCESHEICESMTCKKVSPPEREDVKAAFSLVMEAGGN